MPIEGSKGRLAAMICTALNSKDKPLALDEIGDDLAKFIEKLLDSSEEAAEAVEHARHYAEQRAELVPILLGIARSILENATSLNLAFTNSGPDIVITRSDVSLEVQLLALDSGTSEGDG